MCDIRDSGLQRLGNAGFFQQQYLQQKRHSGAFCSCFLFCCIGKMLRPQLFPDTRKALKQLRIFPLSLLSREIQATFHPKNSREFGCRRFLPFGEASRAPVRRCRSALGLGPSPAVHSGRKPGAHYVRANSARLEIPFQKMYSSTELPLLFLSKRKPLRWVSVW